MAVVVLLGDINIDVVLDVPEYPAEGGEAIAASQTMALGGSATNTAIALARAGHECRLIGRVGDDAWGRQAISDLGAAGVVTTWIDADDGEPTQMNIVTVGPTGERTMFAYRGANARLSAAKVKEEAFASAALFHLSGYALLSRPQSDAARRAIAIANDRNIPVSLDLPSGVVLSIAAEVRALLPKLDMIMLDRTDLPFLFEGSPDCDPRTLIGVALDGGARRIAVKGDGKKSSLYQAESADSASWFTVAVEDTTGAGDAFAAGHIHGLLSGLSGHECCLLANAFGALAITRRGAGQSMPFLSQALALMNGKTSRDTLLPEST